MPQRFPDPLGHPALELQHHIEGRVGTDRHSEAMPEQGPGVRIVCGIEIRRCDLDLADPVKAKGGDLLLPGNHPVEIPAPLVHHEQERLDNLPIRRLAKRLVVEGDLFLASDGALKKVKDL